MKRVDHNLHKIRRGLDLPISGGHVTTITDGPEITEVAVIPGDWVDVTARPVVEPGQRVLAGDLLFEDRRNPGVRFVSPGTGTIAAINRGERRAVTSIVVALDGTGESARFASWRDGGPSGYDAAQARALMIESGLWPSLRERPYGTVPRVDSPACPVFVTAIDTYPLAPDPSLAISERPTEFRTGLETLIRLCDGRPVYACVDHRFGIEDAVNVSGVETHRFFGPHPAGLPGTHMHIVSPASVESPRWHIGYQDVIALGALVLTGKPFFERIVAVNGPSVTEPVIWRTRAGAALGPLIAGRSKTGENRVISGSAVYGRGIFDPHLTFVGPFHNQVTLLPEDRERRFLGWMEAGLHRFSVLPLFLSGFVRPSRLDITTSTHGSPRAVMPFGVMERVMPQDIMATQLCRALLAGDAEWATELGALELDEEDMALCTLVCPGKNDYGPALRNMLTTIRKEG